MVPLLPNKFNLDCFINYFYESLFNYLYCALLLETIAYEDIDDLPIQTLKAKLPPAQETNKSAAADKPTSISAVTQVNGKQSAHKRFTCTYYILSKVKIVCQKKYFCLFYNQIARKWCHP